jgi:hypothetical protein
MVSAEDGLAKPDPAFFQRCLDRLGVRAEEALFVDDTPANVEAARKLGMTVVHYSHKRRDMAEVERLLDLSPNEARRDGGFGCYDAQWVHPRIAVGRWPRPEDVLWIAAAGVLGILNLANFCFREQMLYVGALPDDLAWLHCGIWDG